MSRFQDALSKLGEELDNQVYKQELFNRFKDHFFKPVIAPNTGEEKNNYYECTHCRLRLEVVLSPFKSWAIQFGDYPNEFCKLNQ